MEKRALLQLLGPFPKRTALQPRRLERKDCGSYVREKIEFSAEKGERIRAYLLIPKSLKGKTPAIYCHHQHAGNWDLGKKEVVGLAGDRNQAYAHELAKLGYITFAPDAIAFEERKWDENGRWVNYFELSSRLVQGKTLLAKCIHDISAGIDYLQSRKEVDKKRIGFIGHSYGGRMALWAPVFEKRIKASVSNCGCVNYKDSLPRELGIQMEFCVQGIMNLGDIEDVVRLVEPCNLLISATDNDKWSKGAKKIYNYAKSAFKKGELQLKLYKGKHVFSRDMRNTAYAFLDKHLK